MPIGNKTFTLEIADTSQKREIGLMFRDSMPADHGMIFVFSDEAPRGFWMRNTRKMDGLAHADWMTRSRKLDAAEITDIEGHGAALS